MGSVLLEDLQREIDSGSVIAIIGAGVSIGVTNNQPVASWQGLLHHGVDRCLGLRQLTHVDDEWAKRVHAEIDSGDIDDMLSGAEKISRKLGAAAAPSIAAGCWKQSACLRPSGAMFWRPCAI
jgi:hypothetical protein